MSEAENLSALYRDCLQAVGAAPQPTLHVYVYYANK